MDKTNIVVRVEMDEGSNEKIYGFKVLNFKKVDKIPENLEIITRYQATFSDYEFANLENEAGSEEEEKSLRYLVSALHYALTPGNYRYFLFDVDSYSKFVFLTKMEKGCYVSFN